MVGFYDDDPIETPLEAITVDSTPFVPWFQQLDYEPLKALIKSGAIVQVALTPDEDYECQAFWNSRHLDGTITASAATLDAVLRDTCVQAIRLGVVK